MGSVFPQAGPFPVLVLTGEMVCERFPIIDFAADVFVPEPLSGQI